MTRTHTSFLIGAIALAALAGCDSGTDTGESAEASGESASEEEVLLIDESATPPAVETGAPPVASGAPVDPAVPGTGAMAPASGAVPEGGIADPAFAEIVNQCENILASAWTSVQPAFALLGLPDASQHEEAYIASATTFRERCAANLTPEQRACLEAAEHTVSGMDTCGITADLSTSERPFFPEIDDYVDPLPVLPLPAGEGDAILASIVGTWSSNWETARILSVWTIAADGTVSREETMRDDPPETTSLTISFDEVNRMNVLAGTTTQEYAFVRAGDDVFYSSNNLIYTVFTVPDHTSFTIGSNHGYLVLNGDVCTAVSSRGLVAEATCVFGEEEGEDAFIATYSFPGQMTRMGTPRETTQTWLVSGDNLIDTRMRRFERQ